MEGRCCCSSSPLAHSNVACAYVWEGYELTAGCHLERAAAVRAGARQHGVALRRVDDAVAVAGRSAHGSTDVEAPFHQGRGPGHRRLRSLHSVFVVDLSRVLRIALTG